MWRGLKTVSSRKYFQIPVLKLPLFLFSVGPTSLVTIYFHMEISYFMLKRRDYLVSNMSFPSHFLMVFLFTYLMMTSVSNSSDFDEQTSIQFWNFMIYLRFSTGRTCSLLVALDWNGWLSFTLRGVLLGASFSTWRSGKITSARNCSAICWNHQNLSQRGKMLAMETQNMMFCCSTLRGWQL